MGFGRVCRVRWLGGKGARGEIGNDARDGWQGEPVMQGLSGKKRLFQAVMGVIEMENEYEKKKHSTHRVR